MTNIEDNLCCNLNNTLHSIGTWRYILRSLCSVLQNHHWVLTPIIQPIPFRNTNHSLPQSTLIASAMFTLKQVLHLFTTYKNTQERVCFILSPRRSPKWHTCETLPTSLYPNVVRPQTICRSIPTNNVSAVRGGAKLGISHGFQTVCRSAGRRP